MVTNQFNPFNTNMFNDLSQINNGANDTTTMTFSSGDLLRRICHICSYLSLTWKVVVLPNT